MYDKETIPTLIELAKQGNEDAWTVLYARTHKQLYNVVFRMVKDVDKTYDLLQDIYLKCFTKLHLFRGDSAFTTWIHSVAVNECLMSFRKHKDKYIEMDSFVDEDGANYFERAFKFHDKDLLLEYSLDRILFRKALNSLPVGYRLVFVLKCIDGYQHNEIAAKLRISLGNSKSQVHKAKARLFDLMKSGKFGGNAMTDERCSLCASAGFTNIIAHYGSYRDTQGKLHPALCFDHKWGKIPKYIVNVVKAPEKEVVMAVAASENTVITTSEVQEAVRLCTCKPDCTIPVKKNGLGHWNRYAWGHKPNKDKPVNKVIVSKQPTTLVLDEVFINSLWELLTRDQRTLAILEYWPNLTLEIKIDIIKQYVITKDKGKALGAGGGL